MRTLHSQAFRRACMLPKKMIMTKVRRDVLWAIADRLCHVLYRYSYNRETTIMLMGPPGQGKTFFARRVTEALAFLYPGFQVLWAEQPRDGLTFPARDTSGYFIGVTRVEQWREDVLSSEPFVRLMRSLKRAGTVGIMTTNAPQVMYERRVGGNMDPTVVRGVDVPAVSLDDLAVVFEAKQLPLPNARTQQQLLEATEHALGPLLRALKVPRLRAALQRADDAAALELAVAALVEPTFNVVNARFFHET